MRVLAAFLILLLSVAVRADASCPPEIQGPEILAFQGEEAWIDGRDFGTGAGRTLTISDGVTDYEYDHTEVVSWADTLIKVDLPAGVDSTYDATVTVGDASSAPVALRVYAVTVFDQAPSATIVLDRGPSNELELGVESGNDGLGNCALFSMSSTGVLATRSVASPSIFRNNPVQQIPYEISASQEHVFIDANGDVYISNAGWLLYRQMSGTAAMGSRVIRRTGETMKCYYLPSGLNIISEANGFVLHGDRLLTVVASGHDALFTIDVDDLSSTYTNCNDNNAPPVCGAGGGTPPNCWETNYIPRKFPRVKDPANALFYIGDHYPVHVARSADGAFWIAGHESGELWRLSTYGTDGVWTAWTIPDTYRDPNFAWPNQGPGPWHLSLSGDLLLLTECSTCAVDVFDTVNKTWVAQYKAECGESTAARLMYWSQLDSGDRLWVSGQFGPSADVLIRSLGYFDFNAPNDPPTLFPPISVIPALSGCSQMPQAIAPGNQGDTLKGILGFDASSDGTLIDAAIYYCNGYVLRLTQVP